MKVWKKNTVHLTKNGKRVSKGTPGAKRTTTESKRFYGTLKTLDGKTKQVPLTEDRKSSELLLRRLQTEADHQRATGVTRQSMERQRPIGELLVEFERYLESKGNSQRHVDLTLRRIRKLVAETKTKTLDDLEAGRIANTLSVWRKRKKQPISLETGNHYSRAVKAFSRWCWIEKRSPDDVLRNLRLVNSKVDRKRERRAMTPQELQRLVDATERSGVTVRGIPATDRAMLYTVAAYTGLRASELASLSSTSFDLERCTVTVEAGYSKRRRKDVIPLHKRLVEQVSRWMAERETRNVNGLWKPSVKKWSAMIQTDLKRAGIEYEDANGRVADFHSLRHTFISSLARAGVHPSKAKELARHSTITLTMDVYSHVQADELRTAIDSIPGF